MFGFMKKFRKANDFVENRSVRSLFHFNDNASWEMNEYENYAKEGYLKNVIAHRAVNLIASSAASVPWLLYVQLDSGKKKELEKHDVLSLLGRPNCQMSTASFFEKIYSYRLISGNVFLQKIFNGSQVVEIHALRPDKVEIIMNKNSHLPKGYLYRANENDDEGKFFPINQITGESDILHWKNFNPLDEISGASPMESASYSIEQHNQASVWNQSLLKNGARPTGALVLNSSDGFSNSLTEDQFERLKGQIDDKYSGAANSGRPILLEGGMQWQEMSMSPCDMDFIECKHSSARDISLAFGVPPQLLGIPGDSTYSNMQEARLALWEETILPMVNSLKDALNHWLVRGFNDRLMIDYDDDEISGLTKKREIKLNSLENVSFMTINEKRQAIGLSPLEGQDEIKNNKGDS